MKSKLSLALALLTASLALHAADPATPAAPADEKTHAARVIMMTEFWLPEYVVNAYGKVTPVEAKPYQSPPAGLGISNGKNFTPVNVPCNVLGEELVISGDKLQLSTSEMEAPAKDSGDKKPKRVVRPFLTVPLERQRSLVCIYPRLKNDWRSVGQIVVGLDAPVTYDGKIALVLNVSRAPIVMRLDPTKPPASIAPGGSAFVPCRSVEGKVKIQAAAKVGGQDEVVADTTLDWAGEGLPLMVFTNSDPKLAGLPFSFVKDFIPAPPPAPAPVAPAETKPAAKVATK